MAKHKSVLRQNTFKTLLKSVLPKQKVICKTHMCFQSVGPVCWKHFWKDTNFLKHEKGISNIGDFKKIWNRAKIFFGRPSVLPPPFFPQSSVFLATNWCPLKLICTTSNGRHMYHCLPSVVICCLSSVPIEFPRKYISTLHILSLIYVEVAKIVETWKIAKKIVSCVSSYHLFPFLTQTPYRAHPNWSGQPSVTSLVGAAERTLTGRGSRTHPNWSGQPNAP